jgi:predicted transcriptional regulator YheO
VYKKQAGFPGPLAPTRCLASGEGPYMIQSPWRSIAVAPSLDPRLVPFMPLVRGLAHMFGPDCEVVLHDLGDLPRSIVAIENGHVSGRRVGDVPTDLMLRTVRRAQNGAVEPRVYVTSSRGKTLRSLSVTLRDADGHAFGLLGLNLDVSALHEAQRSLTALTTAPGAEAGAGDAEEIFAGDIREVVAGMIAQAVAESGKSPAQMSREEKMDVVKRLEERGAFLVKRSAEQVAEALDLSRFTIFAYLKEIRRPAAGGGASADAQGEPPA